MEQESPNYSLPQTRGFNNFHFVKVQHSKKLIEKLHLTGFLLLLSEADSHDFNFVITKNVEHIMHC